MNVACMGRRREGEDKFGCKLHTIASGICIFFSKSMNRLINLPKYKYNYNQLDVHIYSGLRIRATITDLIQPNVERFTSRLIVCVCVCVNVYIGICINIRPR